MSELVPRRSTEIRCLSGKQERELALVQSGQQLQEVQKEMGAIQERTQQAHQRLQAANHRMRGYPFDNFPTSEAELIEKWNLDEILEEDEAILRRYMGLSQLENRLINDIRWLQMQLALMSR